MNNTNILYKCRTSHKDNMELAKNFLQLTEITTVQYHPENCTFSSYIF